MTEVEYIWENARAYNEEGSFIHENANKLRVCLPFRVCLMILTQFAGLVLESLVGYRQCKRCYAAQKANPEPTKESAATTNSSNQVYQCQ
jgi:hypothetical protein